MASRKMSFKIGDVLIRQGEHSDFQGVMDIDDNVYDGFDYLPSMFDMFLQSRNYLFFVCEQHGKIIGLINYYISDFEPHIVCGLSGRMVKEWRGRAFSRVFEKHFMRINPQFTSALFVTWTKFEIPGSTRLYHWNSVFYKFPVDLLIKNLNEFRSVDKISQCSPVRQLTYNMVDDLLRTNTLEQFFTNYCLDYVPGQWHYRPMRIDKPRLKELFSTSSWALVTDSNLASNKDEDQASNHVHQERSDSTIVAISYSYFFQVKVGVSCEVFFFGDDVNVAISHAISHAEHLATVVKGNAGFVIHVPSGLDIEKICDALHRVLGNRFKAESFVMGLRPVLRNDSKL